MHGKHARIIVSEYVTIAIMESSLCNGFFSVDREGMDLKESLHKESLHKEKCNKAARICYHKYETIVVWGRRRGNHMISKDNNTKKPNRTPVTSLLSIFLGDGAWGKLLSVLQFPEENPGGRQPSEVQQPGWRAV